MSNPDNRLGRFGTLAFVTALVAEACSSSSATAAPEATKTPDGIPSTAVPTASASAEATRLCETFPAAGSVFHSNRMDANGNDPYRVIVTPDGRYWQDQLPDPEHRQSYAVALRLPRNNTYRFDGIVANGYLDLTNNGQGSQDTRVAHYQNNVRFNVPASNGTEIDQQNAWFLVEGQGGVPGGFQLQVEPPVATCN